MTTNWPAIRIGCLIFASAALATSPSDAQTQEPSAANAASSVISSVAITQGAERASVRVEGAGPLEVHAARVQNPDRLVLDFSDAKLAVQKTVIPGLSAPVRGVRLGQFRPDVARVVIDLTAATPYQISRDGLSVVVSFASVAQPATDSVPTLKAASEKIPVERPAFHYGVSAPRGAVAPSAKLRRISAPRFALPGELTQPSVVLASFGGSTEPARPTPQQAAQQQSGNAAATVGNSQVAATGRYTGEPISVNLKDVDLKDFFRLIHEISGLNIVLDPAVHGSLTIVLDEVPWDQALDIVLQNNGLDKQLSGNVLRIATRDTMKKEAETQRDLERAQAEAVAPVTVTRVLSYGKADKMKDTLKKFMSSRGDILSDDRSNQLIIRDIPSVIPVIDNLIRQLDRKSQQVEIEARVVSASRTFAQDIGVQLGFAGAHGSCSTCLTVVGGNSEVGTSPTTTGTGIAQPPLIGGGGSSSTAGIPFNVNLGATAPTSGLGIFHRSPNFALDFFISAAESKGVGKLLSKPRVVTQNNEKAIIKQGQKIPIQTTINNTISVQFIDAVLKLEVTPQITAEGTVFMDVLVENTQIDQGIPRIQGVPALDTQSEETKILVADGGTVVVGGIIVSNQNVTTNEVPLLGSLPLIGHLFKRNNITISSNELLFFLTPRIIPG
jgi:type IV pilus assembly protein PilQ